MYRQTASHNWLAELKNAVMGDMGKSNGGGQLRRRSPIAIRLYRDIPVPTWRIVFPDKLLQFRPLDGLRSDLFSIAGQLCCPPTMLFLLSLQLVMLICRHTFLCSAASASASFQACRLCVHACSRALSGERATRCMRVSKCQFLLNSTCCDHMRGLIGVYLAATGILAFIAQAKYDSVILDIITLGSLFVLITRVVLGYKRMYDRSAGPPLAVASSCSSLQALWVGFFPQCGFHICGGRMHLAMHFVFSPPLPLSL